MPIAAFSISRKAIWEIKRRLNRSGGVKLEDVK